MTAEIVPLFPEIPAGKIPVEARLIQLAKTLVEHGGAEDIDVKQAIDLLIEGAAKITELKMKQDKFFRHPK